MEKALIIIINKKIDEIAERMAFNKSRFEI